MARRVKVHVDRDDCISCGSCWALCPEVFEENPADGLTQVVAKFRTGTNLGDGEAPEELETGMREAEEACPVQIIHVQVVDDAS